METLHYGRLWQWPRRDGQFVGRSIELGRLHGLLDATRRVLLCGPVGIGKRALIVEYGHRFAATYGDRGYALRWDFLSDGRAPWRRSGEGGLCMLDHEPGPTGRVAAEARLLEALSRMVWAAPGTKVVAAAESAAVQQAALSLGFALLPLPPLSVEEGLSLLVERSGRHQVEAADKQAARELAAELGGVPAALCRVADLARRQDLSWRECQRRNLAERNLL